MVATEQQPVKVKHYSTPCEALLPTHPGMVPKPCGKTVQCQHARPEDKFNAPHGKMRKFYLARVIRGVQIQDDKPYSQPVNINGHLWEVHFGQINEAPDEILQMLLSARSKTVVVDVDAAERMPRNLKAGERAPVRTETVCDYEIQVID